MKKESITKFKYRMEALKMFAQTKSQSLHLPQRLGAELAISTLNEIMNSQEYIDLIKEIEE